MRPSGAPERPARRQYAAAVLTAANVERFRETQLKRSGCRFDWSHEVNTTDPGFYRWTQWLFVQLFRAGLATGPRGTRPRLPANRGRAS